MITRLSACLEMLFIEDPQFDERIRRAADLGFGAVEFWLWSNKDISAIKSALRVTGVALSGFVAEPMVPLTDRNAHETFLQGLEGSAAVASDLGAPFLIAQTGDLLDDRPRNEQRNAIIDCLKRATDVLSGTGVRLLVEPLNTRVDHLGYFLHSTAEGLDIIQSVDRAEIGLLYDLYHSYVMNERPEDVLAERIYLIGHLHLADAPGRNEPGNGAMDWQDRLQWIVTQGYEGALGLEYTPTGASDEAVKPVLDWFAAQG